MDIILYTVTGYLAGSILFARLTATLMGKEELLTRSKDQNPGTANAFLYGGFACGVLTLLGDLLKGGLPVFLYLQKAGMPAVASPLFALVLVAPVLGHIYSVFYHFQGGKGIAVTFGVLLGLYPVGIPVLTLAFFFLFFSLIIRVSPHFQRTIVTYISTAIVLLLLKVPVGVSLGFVVITAAVCLHMHASKEEREKVRIQLLWKH